jgi:hypothetical protein
MSYIVNLETFSGSVKKISLPSKGAVAQFISNYPNQLPLGVRGTIRGKAVAK